MNNLLDDSVLAEFLHEFGLAKIHIKLYTRINQLRRLQEGRQLQHSRWEKMGHGFVFTGLDGLIVTGKGNSHGF